jgi:hypothetical protein
MAWRRTRVCMTALVTVVFAVFFFAAVKQASAGTAATPTPTAVRQSVNVSVQTDAWISAEADYLSGRKLTVVCAATTEEWAQALKAAGFPPAEADKYYGFSLIGQGEMHLSPYVCEGLRLGVGAPRQRSNELQVSWSVNVLVHESVHMARFTRDEALTEACARIGLPVELHRLYRVAYYSAEMSRLTSAATRFRSTMGPAYQGGTCSAPSA